MTAVAKQAAEKSLCKREIAPSAANARCGEAARTLQRIEFFRGSLNCTRMARWHRALLIGSKLRVNALSPFPDEFIDFAGNFFPIGATCSPSQTGPMVAGPPRPIFREHWFRLIFRAQSSAICLKSAGGLAALTGPQPCSLRRGCVNGYAGAGRDLIPLRTLPRISSHKRQLILEDIGGRTWRNCHVRFRWLKRSEPHG